MLDTSLKFINETFIADFVSPRDMDVLLARGWRHFGSEFFRYSLSFYEGQIERVLPLRIRLADFKLSKSQRRTLNRNDDVEVSFGEINIDREAEELFDRHRERFRRNAPETIYNFLDYGERPSPTTSRELRVRLGGELLAVSYFDVGENAVSGIYAMFDPEHSLRRLGIYTLLAEIDLAIKEGKRFYYLGYCYESSSFYDYKKRFAATEAFDWAGNWQPFAANEESE